MGYYSPGGEIPEGQGTLPFTGDGIDHDPLDPHPDVPTPLDLVMRLTRPQRLDRVRALTDLAWQRYEEALALRPEREVTAVCSLVSGGRDSYTVAHLFRNVTGTFIHANTGAGIEATRQHVRDTAKAWGRRMVEERPDEGEGYFDLVLGDVRTKTTDEIVWPGGFPGPAMHYLMQQRLKERPMDKARHTLGVANSTKRRAIWIAGRRRTESDKRRTVPHHETDGSIDWCSPIAVWHKQDLHAYRLLHDDVPRNPVAETLGMSGECGCLSNARRGEPERWRAAYPDDPFILRVAEVEELLKPRRDIPEHRKTWGWGGVYDDREEMAALKALNVMPAKPGRMCGPSCGDDPLIQLMDPLWGDAA